QFSPLPASGERGRGVRGRFGVQALPWKNTLKRVLQRKAAKRQGLALLASLALFASLASLALLKVKGAKREGLAPLVPLAPLAPLIIPWQRPTCKLGRPGPSPPTPLPASGEREKNGVTSPTVGASSQEFGAGCATGRGRAFAALPVILDWRFCRAAPY